MSTPSQPILPPSPRPVNWKSLAPAPPDGSLTFAAQSTLKKLPVPSLPDTLAKLKISLVPLAQSPEELDEAVRRIDEFGKSNEARELQKRLLAKYDDSAHWLETWWDDGGYLGYRDSVVVNVSYYYGFDDHPAHLPQTPAARAAAITRAAMIFRQRLLHGEAKPDAVKEGPFCMDTYRWMFDNCRVPGPHGLDWSVSYTKKGDTGNSGHIIVIRNNRVWKLDSFKDGQLLSTSDLEKQFKHVYDNSAQKYPGVGVLTASNRDIWAKDYIKLTSEPHNASILRDIHSSAFIVALDSATPYDPISHSRDLWHGHLSPSGVPEGLQNRWVDKPAQFIVFDNAKAGYMGEHSIMDGTPAVRLCDEVLDSIQDPSFDHGASSSSSIEPPKPLDWVISPEITSAISRADKAARELITSQALSFYLTSYGKAAIKTFGVSPDSWAQMIIQLAFRRLLGGDLRKRVGGTYEAATTRRFFKGRTEAIRVVTTESDAWTESMDNDNIDVKERKHLFDAATRKHVEIAKSAGTGQGVDRHMFGLKKLIREGENIPAVFEDALVKRSSYWVLSTSAIFSKHFPVYGWGEVVPDGFGVAYMTGYDDRLQFTITSRTEMPNEQFCNEIAKAAVDLYDLHASITTDTHSRL